MEVLERNASFFFSPAMVIKVGVEILFVAELVLKLSGVSKPFYDTSPESVFIVDQEVKVHWISLNLLVAE